MAFLPAVAPAEVGDWVGTSHASVTFDGGAAVTLWSAPGATLAGDTETETQLLLQPDRPVVIGRQQGGEVPYLDPSYTPTHVVSDSGQSVLTQAGQGSDRYVSRGHFLLRGSAEGLRLLNGVPRREGGVRPPVNGTWLVEPECRRLEAGEEYLIGRGRSAKIRLPNGTGVLIQAGGEPALG